MAAQTLGFSKPINNETPMRAIRVYNPYMGVSDGVDCSEVLAMTMKNNVELAPDLTGSDLDEMSIDFLKAIPTYYQTNTLSTADTPGTQIFSNNISPAYANLNTTDGAVTNVYCFSTVGFLAQRYCYWRGSLVYRGRLVKTKFHSGRYMIAVTYGDKDLTALPSVSLTNTQYVYRTMLDIRECDEFEIVVPYVSKSPWMECGLPTNSKPIGLLSMIAVDPLVAPASVASTISIIWEI